MNISCNIIKDILPLYVEDIVSEDTRVLVENHINDCIYCKKEFEEMREPKNIPIDTNTDTFKSIRNKLFREKLKVIIFSITVTIFFIMLGINYLTKPNYIPYSKDIISINTNDNGIIFVDFGDKVSGYNINKYQSEDGEGYSYSITTWENIWSKYISSKEVGTLVLNPNGEKINSIYYYSGNRRENSSINSSGDILIYGKRIIENGVIITLPRLVLTYYFIIAIVLTILSLIILILVRKNKKFKNIIEKIVFIPISYIIAHLCIKGLNSTSYNVLRDFYLILIISVFIYLLFIMIINFYKKFKYKN